MSFFFTGVTVGDPTIVKADCGDGAGYRTLNLTTFDDGNGSSQSIFILQRKIKIELMM